MSTKKNDVFESLEKQKAEKVSAHRVHIVRKGDTLRTIAREYLGDSSRMEEIRKMNDLATNILKVGRELTIPER